MKVNWRKCINCLLIGLATIIILALAYSINLGMKQQDALIDMNAVADRIIIKVEQLESERLKLERENAELRALEDKTAEELKDVVPD